MLTIWWHVSLFFESDVLLTESLDSNSCLSLQQLMLYAKRRISLVVTFGQRKKKAFQSPAIRKLVAQYHLESKWCRYWVVSRIIQCCPIVSLRQTSVRMSQLLLFAIQVLHTSFHAKSGSHNNELVGFSEKKKFQLVNAQIHLHSPWCNTFFLMSSAYT